MRVLCVALAAMFSGSALADVKSATPIGFEVESKAVVAATPAETYAALGRVGEWWSSDHTYSGDAANMRLELKAGGCFCERVPATGATIEHGRVVYAAPGDTLRLQGGLGPLQAEAAIGTLTWQLKPVSGGTEVIQTYVAGGYIRDGAAALAQIVDQVMAEQLNGLQKRLAK